MATAELETVDNAFDLSTVTFDITKEEIEKRTQEHMQLVVRDLNDKEGIAAVHEARMGWVKLRNNIDRRRKQKNENAQEYISGVNSMAKELVELFAPTENYLKTQESIVEREKERLRQEEDRKHREMIATRLQLLADAGYSCVYTTIEFLTDQEFDAMLAEKLAEKKAREDAAGLAAAEAARIAEANRIESERLANEKAELDRQRAEQEKAAAEQQRIADEKLSAERAELERQRQEQAVAQAKIDTENKRIADEQAAKQRALEMEKAKADAAEKARKEAIAAQKRKDDAAKAKAAKAEAELKRLESLRPDHEKLLAVADAVAAIVLPKVSKEAKDAVAQVGINLEDCQVRIRQVANKLMRTAEIV